MAQDNLNDLGFLTKVELEDAVNRVYDWTGGLYGVRKRITWTTDILRGVPAEEVKEEPASLWGAPALMDWLGKHFPGALKKARSFAGSSGFREYMAELTGVTQEHFDSHGHACEAYLAALKRKVVVAPVSTTPTLDRLENTAEPQRERLTWADSKAPDRFPGYSVTSNTNEAKQGPSHALQRTSEGERIPGFGSAALLKVR
jgi:hypothetical protein